LTTGEQREKDLFAAGKGVADAKKEGGKEKDSLLDEMPVLRKKGKGISRICLRLDPPALHRGKGKKDLSESGRHCFKVSCRKKDPFWIVGD